MLTQAQADERVAKGAAHLDKVRPGWERQIDTGTLTLHDPCGCIVGQLIPGTTEDSFDAGLRLLGIKNDGFDVGVSLRVSECLIVSSHEGIVDWFNASSTARKELIRPGFQVLQNAWIREIAQRLLSPVSEAGSGSSKETTNEMQMR